MRAFNFSKIILIFLLYSSITITPACASLGENEQYHENNQQLGHLNNPQSEIKLMKSGKDFKGTFTKININQLSAVKTEIKRNREMVASTVVEQDTFDVLFALKAEIEKIDTVYFSSELKNGIKEEALSYNKVDIDDSQYHLATKNNINSLNDISSADSNSIKRRKRRSLSCSSSASPNLDHKGYRRSSDSLENQPRHLKSLDKDKK